MQRKYTWDGPGNFSLGGRLYPPGVEIELDDDAVMSMDRTVSDRLSPVVERKPAPVKVESDEAPKRKARKV